MKQLETEIDDIKDTRQRLKESFANCFLEAHRKVLDYDRFELQDQNYLLSNIVLLIQTNRLPLNSLAFNILCSNVRGLCLSADWSDSIFKYNPQKGLIECTELMENATAEMRHEKKLYCCTECKHTDVQMRE